MRHAKSSWDNNLVSDFDRPLNSRGEKSAPLMGEILLKKNIKPDLILASPANRAKTTATIVGEILGTSVTYQKSIYESSLMNIMMILNAIEEDVESCLLVGHNPALTALINALSDFSLDNLPTAGVVAITFASAWSEIEPRSGAFLFFEYPKKYRV